MSKAKNLIDLIEAVKSDPEKEKILKDKWNKINDKFFDGKLKEPKFIVPKFRRGSNTFTCHFGSGELSVTDIIFIDDKFLDFIVKHEMCHQAVQELHSDVKEKDHGKLWKSIATRVGIDTSARVSPSEAIKKEMERINYNYIMTTRQSLIG